MEENREEKLKKRKYTPLVPNTVYIYKDKKYTLAGLCTHFHLRYTYVRDNLCVKNMNIVDAINDALANPRAWGKTYSFLDKDSESVDGKSARGKYPRKPKNKTE